MTTIVSYNTPADLVAAVGEANYMACLDDTGSNSRTKVDAGAEVTNVLEAARVLVESYLPGAYDTMPDTQATNPAKVSQLLKYAERVYATALMYQRRTEYMKLNDAGPGGKMYKAADALLERIKSGQQRIPPTDNPPAAKPSSVGGSTMADGSRIALTSTDGVTTNTGDW